jgi:hypothetical protein
VTACLGAFVDRWVPATCICYSSFFLCILHVLMLKGSVKLLCINRGGWVGGWSIPLIKPCVGRVLAHRVVDMSLWRQQVGRAGVFCVSFQLDDCVIPQSGF